MSSRFWLYFAEIACTLWCGLLRRQLYSRSRRVILARRRRETGLATHRFERNLAAPRASRGAVSAALRRHRARRRRAGRRQGADRDAEEARGVSRAGDD